MVFEFHADGRGTPCGWSRGGRQGRQGAHPLFYTAYSLTPQPRFAIKLLDEAGASVNVEDNYLRTPLDFAMKNRGDSSALRRVLVQRGAKRGKRNRLKYQSDSLSGEL